MLFLFKPVLREENSNMNLITRIRRWFNAPPVSEETAVKVEKESLEDVPEKETTVVFADKPCKELEAAIIPQEAVTAPLASGVFNVGWITDIGQVRDHNEDGLFIFMAEQQSANAIPAFGLFVLADGMGGHQAGELASTLASRVVAEHLLAQVYLPLLRGDERLSTQPSLTELLTEAIAAANRAVHRDLPDSGTTLTCGLILGQRLFIGHVGDSRAYLRRVTGENRLLTQDHSMVNKLVEIGQLTPAEAAVHPQRNMLYRAVGQGTALDVDVLTLPLYAGDQLLLCSDGLWGEVPAVEMWRLIARAATPTEACVALKQTANEVGGKDNITAILIEIQECAW